MGTGYRERIYEGYQRHARPDPGDRLRARSLDQLVQAHFPPERSARMLDLGCGDGAILRAARRAGYTDRRGIDGAAGMVARAHETGSIEVEHGELLDALASSPADHYDIVVAYDVLEHLERDEQLALLDGARRTLRKGGRLLLHVPNGAAPFAGSVLHGDATHVTAFTRGSLTQLFRATGFVRARFHEERPIVSGPRSALRAVLWDVLRTGVQLSSWVETGWFDRNAIVSRNLVAVAFK